MSNKALKGFAWTSFQKIASMAVSFTANLILARLLTPSDFGILGIILVFINLSTIFIDAGFGSALIQKKDATSLDFSTVFYWNLIVAVVLYFLLFVSSPYLSIFFKIDKLTSVLRILGLVLITNSLSITQITIQKRNLDFKLMSVSFVSASIIAFTITIFMAYKGYGVWSLVAFQLIQSTVNTIILWIRTDWRPTLQWSWVSFKGLFRYGGFLLMSSLIGTLSKQMQTLLIGKVCNTKILGYFSQAKTMENAPANIIYSVVGQVVFPLFSKHQHNKAQYEQTYLQIINGVAFLTIPLMFLLIVIGKPLILLLLTDKWLNSVVYFQLLCLAGITVPLIDMNIFAISAIGNSKLIFKYSLINNIICIIMIIVGAIWSIYGIIISFIIFNFYSYIIYSLLVKKNLRISLKKQWLEVIKFILISIIATVSTWPIIEFCNFNNFTICLIGVLCFASVYIIFAYLLRINELHVVINIIKQKTIRH